EVQEARDHRPRDREHRQHAGHARPGGTHAVGGVPAHASSLRMAALSASASSTSSRKVARMVLASPPLSIFIDWSISWPSPPAPTKPMMTEARTAHSQRYTV